ncbi:NAD(P)/FAD-dependent oxidoreductase [Polymorphospora rubra]|uniref:NAD(P)/FAD-dependent oxidoreductase n=1 Tax=Polymorphospora rubra TaxID=338584 RepID=UPI0033CD1AB6
MPTTPAVVLGAGIAGLLAAAVLARHPQVGEVTVVERDRLEPGPQPRRGLPQGQHAHVLMSSGARIIETLLPGTTDRWLAAGAHRIGLPDGYVMLLPAGWLPRWSSDHFVISCSRGLLDWVVRQQVLALPGVRLVDRTEATGLRGGRGRVTGVRVEDLDHGTGRTLEAGFVVDATGRGSRAPHWLRSLGAPPVVEDVVDSGLRYATRVFRAPAGAAHRFPIVNVQADPGQDRPGQTAALMPVEDGRWLVTLSGTRGGRPSADEREFVGFARGMRHPVVADLIADADPLGPVTVSNSTANRRRRFERLPGWPDGFVVLGDAVASYNPVYGHGMSVAAHGAAALGAALDGHGLRSGLARTVQRRIVATAAAAWDHATGTDVRFPGARGRPPGRAERALWRYQTRLMRTALDRPEVARQLVDVLTLSAPANRLVRPGIALATLLGPRRPAPDGPTFTAAERAMLSET